ncbi:P-loop containing nucleoside triphosphate hydrolase protein [Crepidotus variabilis]|uniref:P-loop containing nucleoside triphosphate hydrolase protein n=1 Tax=Crepidotus variabilis TaxID=179855 RepID=A0A9P6JSP1_9AGAR|nr:P-loop containing nucleoside triphosphate hydrolase protein [Crepidotus variabilis]
MFSATGLLGPNAALSTRPLQDPQSGNTTFISTGLLSITTPKEENESEIQADLDMGIHTIGEEPLSFLNTGLLSTASSAPPSSRATTPHSLDNEDDLELPAVTETPKGRFSPETAASMPRYIPKTTVSATTFEGKTLLLNRKTKLTGFNNVPSTSSSNQYRNLLDVPIHRLMDQLSTATASKLQRNEVSCPVAEQVNEDVLLVDRYRPRKFTDLVGNEKVARDALSWIKQWDFCVFGKSKGKKRQRDDDEISAQDKYRRPREKILLLSGPPGLGKTTLAHVLAKQAGYEVMEINASDARSGSIIDERIRPTLESGSAIGSTKPVLVVIDEIDGATGAGDNSGTFVARLVHLVQAKQFKRRGKKDQGPRPILRPIICICNDLNASALTKLRPHAYSIRFYRPADAHLVNRLKEICQLEGLKAESRALSTLVSSAKGDLRGCLNTLQFIKTRGENVTEAIVRKATAGMKEADTNYLTVLNNLFTPLSKKRVKDLGLTDEEEGKYVGRLSHEIDGSGRENNIASGCFGYYATLRRHDANLSRHEQAARWLTTFDSFSSSMYNEGDFTLSHYLPYTLVPFYHLFNQRGGDRVERNQADWEHFQLSRSNEEVLHSLSRCLRTATIRYGGDFRHLLSHPILQLEFVPYINRIISPPLRPVNSQIIRPQEKALMTRLVDIMASLELRFVQEKGDDGQLSYRLDPPVDVFVTYDGKRAADITVSRYAVRHLVAVEIEAKLIVHESEFTEKSQLGKRSIFATKSSVNSNVVANDENGTNMNSSSNQPSKRQRLDVQDIADKPPTDFFGRLITVPAFSTTNQVPKEIHKPFKVSYKFLEGNSAAVRKPVKVNSFI